MLHCERIVKEIIALTYCAGFTVDVGGNPSRHFKMARSNVWSACPPLTGSDVARNERHEKGPSVFWCTHTIPEGPDDCPCSHPSTYLSVDSLYYLEPDTVCRMVQNAPLIAVVHDFTRPSAVLYGGEAQYNVDTKGEVLMTVRGSSIAYRHSNLGWLHSANVHECSAGSMTWYMLKNVGTSVIYRFQKCSTGMASDPMPLVLRLTDD